MQNLISIKTRRVFQNPICFINQNDKMLKMFHINPRQYDFLRAIQLQIKPWTFFINWQTNEMKWV